MVHMKPTADMRKPYSGHARSLVIAIDVGTTFSGVSYAILEPGEVPKIHGVTRFPGQEHVAGNSKIPSVMYYDKNGRMMAAGAEADTSSVLSQAEDDGWIKTELFKLRLRPRTMKLDMNGMRLGALPYRKTAVDVFGDFLAYLYRCTRNFITDTHANGAAMWNAVEHDIQFVLSHPNGWEGAQQTKMRRSAVYGGLIPDTNEGRARIRFVTEGEASLHACVLNGLAADVLSNPSKHGFLIADAGGGTLDISSYAIRGTVPLIIEEIAPPDCIFAGSVFVSRRAREFLEEKLKKSKYGTPDALDHITKRFDETTKRLFRDRRDLQFIPFGSPLDKDPTVGIRGGQLKLTGDEVANLFEPSIQAAVTAIKTQIDASAGVIKSVFLVGGYAASPWLFNQLQERLGRLKVTVSRPDTQTSKAVADGAIGFYCDHHVSARMSKFMYGVEFLRELDPRDPEHVSRKERLCELPSGPKLLPDAFDCILARSVKVKESTVFTRKYCTELTSLSMLSVFEVEIWCYRGGNTVPKWINRQADDFSTLCVVRADLSPLSGSAEPKTGRGGRTYWTIVFSVEIHFGLTEFRARIKWVDDGKTKYGPASIVYNERGHRAEEDEPDSYPEDDMGPGSARSDRHRSEPVSRARSMERSFSGSANGDPSKRTSTYDLPPAAPLEMPDRLYEPEVRTPSKSRQPSVRTSPEISTRDRDRDIDRDRVRSSKGKERERERTSSGVSSRARGIPAAELADTLTAVWGESAPSPNVQDAQSTISPKVNKKDIRLSPEVAPKHSPKISSPLAWAEPAPQPSFEEPPPIEEPPVEEPPAEEPSVEESPVEVPPTPIVEAPPPPPPVEAAPPAKGKKSAKNSPAIPAAAPVETVTAGKGKKGKKGQQSKVTSPVQQAPPTDTWGSFSDPTPAQATEEPPMADLSRSIPGSFEPETEAPPAEDVQHEETVQAEEAPQPEEAVPPAAPQEEALVDNSWGTSGTTKKKKKGQSNAASPVIDAPPAPEPAPAPEPSVEAPPAETNPDPEPIVETPVIEGTKNRKNKKGASKVTSPVNEAAPSIWGTPNPSPQVSAETPAAEPVSEPPAEVPPTEVAPEPVVENGGGATKGGKKGRKGSSKVASAIVPDPPPLVVEPPAPAQDPGPVAEVPPAAPAEESVFDNDWGAPVSKKGKKGQSKASSPLVTNKWGTSNVIPQATGTTPVVDAWGSTADDTTPGVNAWGSTADPEPTAEAPPAPADNGWGVPASQDETNPGATDGVGDLLTSTNDGWPEATAGDNVAPSDSFQNTDSNAEYFQNADSNSWSFDQPQAISKAATPTGAASPAIPASPKPPGSHVGTPKVPESTLDAAPTQPEEAADVPPAETAPPPPDAPPEDPAVGEAAGEAPVDPTPNPADVANPEEPSAEAANPLSPTEENEPAGSATGDKEDTLAEKKGAKAAAANAAKKKKGKGKK